MEIYFAGSIRGASADKSVYKRIIEHLTGYGRVLTEHSFDYSYSEEIKVDDGWIYSTDMGWLTDADVLVAEVSSPSLGVGYEIGKAEDMGKPILCLYRRQEGRRLSAMINGNDNLAVVEYEGVDEALSRIEEFMKGLEKA